MQVVYLLDVAARTLKYLNGSCGKSLNLVYLSKVCFTPDSSMILIYYQTYGGPLLEVHQHGGQLLHQMSLQQPRFAGYGMSVACLAGNRAVLATTITSRRFRALTLTFWDLHTGQEHGVVQLLKAEREGSEGSNRHPFPRPTSLLCTDTSASRLAVVGPDGISVHLFDAGTLQALCSWCPATGPSGGSLSGLKMGAYSYLLQSEVDHGLYSKASYLYRLATGTDVCSHTTHISSTDWPALSKDDAFIAYICREGVATVRICDTRSGVMVVAHQIPILCGQLGPASLAWIGSSLMVTSSRMSADPGTSGSGSTDQIHVLRF